MRVRIDGAGCRRLCRRQSPEPDLSAESTPTGGWCQMKQASIFTEIWPKFCQIFTNFHNFPQISANLVILIIPTKLREIP